MKTRHVLSFFIAITLIALLSCPATAQAPPARENELRKNAAMRYWQAFAHMPRIEDAHEKLFDPASDEAGTGPGPEGVKLAQSSRDALLYLQRGAAIGPCDWGLHREDGPNLLLPQLSRARDLARLARLRARIAFATGESRAAGDDLLNSMAMARHLGADLSAIVTYLVQQSIENLAIETLATQLAGFDAATLDHLDKRLAALPPGGSLQACLRVERETFYDWALKHLKEMKDEDPWKEKVLRPITSSPQEQNEIIAACGGTREGVIQQLEAFRPYYDEVGQILPLPRDQFLAKLKEIETRYTSNPIAKGVMISVGKVYDRDAAARTRQTLLQAALAIAKAGPEQAGSFKDANGHPIEHQATPNGFELKSTVLESDKPVVLVVGGRKTAK